MQVEWVGGATQQINCFRAEGTSKISVAAEGVPKQNVVTPKAPKAKICFEFAERMFFELIELYHDNPEDYDSSETILAELQEKYDD